MKKTLLCLALTSLLTACGDKKTTVSSAASQPATSPALAAVFAAQPADAPVAIHQARTSAKPGDELTLQGRVMGSLKPFVEGRAAFILGDPAKLTPCNEQPGDGCDTPWDTCCDTPGDIKAGTATIQVVDAEGRVLKESIENVNGLKPLSTVIVSGAVAEGSHPGLLILNASAIQLAP